MSDKGTSSQPQHFLQLKVMRLSRSTFISEAGSEMGTDAAPVWLPSSFGNIYLGETFSSYLCLCNEYPVSVSDVALRAELQTSSHRVTLMDSGVADTPGTLPSHVGMVPDGAASRLRRSGLSRASEGPLDNAEAGAAGADTGLDLRPGETAECSISHEIKELGTHILVCSAQYTLDQERRFFRKFYKFQVLNPLSVRTKVNALADGTGFLEAQVQNAHVGGMLFDRIALDPAVQFWSREVAAEANASHSQGEHPWKRRLEWDAGPFPLLPQDVRQLLFVLHPRRSVDGAVSSPSTSLGKLDISWITPVGGQGRLQTSQLVRKLPLAVGIEMTVRDVEPSCVVSVGSTILCRLRLRNNTSDAMDVAVDGPRHRPAGLVILGPVTSDIGVVEPGQEREITMTLCALAPGLHAIGPMSAKDRLSGVSREIDSVADILVT
ncbi:hypothetical protein DFJ74DRAFT_232637 [Hyaloraphidium curvatum]|nr:hypothetical protein DFJ74DRAFT_232637 [Hyaloraphidium curvatum]